METWKPRPKQKKVLEAAMIPGVNRTITAICNEAGVTTRTFYNWLGKDKNFLEAWNTIWELSIDRYMPSVVAAQVKQAQEGSTPAAKYLSELAGKMIKRHEVKGRLEYEVVWDDDNDGEGDG